VQPDLVEYRQNTGPHLGRVPCGLFTKVQQHGHTVPAADRDSIRPANANAVVRLTEFFTTKHQLARRINNEQIPVLAEPQLVHTIVGLTHSGYRTHIRLQRPNTFADLRQIAAIMDTPDDPPPRPLTIPEHGKRGQSRTSRQPRTPRPRDGTAGIPLPRDPCRYCGGPHWNIDCPTNTPASGNAR